MFNSHTAQKRLAIELKAQSLQEKQESILKHYHSEVQPELLNHYQKRLKSFILKVSTHLLRWLISPLLSMRKTCCLKYQRPLILPSLTPRIGKVSFLWGRGYRKSLMKNSWTKGRYWINSIVWGAILGTNLGRDKKESKFMLQWGTTTLSCLVLNKNLV